MMERGREGGVGRREGRVGREENDVQHKRV